MARQLLMDVSGDDAGTLLRSWPTMVAAAADLWASLPVGRPAVDEARSRHHPPLRQAATVEASLSGRKALPGQGPTDPRINQMTHNLATATSLVRRYGATSSRTLTARPIATSKLPGPRIVHGLHLAAHAVTVALHEHGRDRVNDARDDAGRPLQLAMHHTPPTPSHPWGRGLTGCPLAKTPPAAT